MPKRVKHLPDVTDTALPPAPPAYREYMRQIGRKGGRASGARRLENLTPKQRSAIARTAARARWNAAAKKAAE
jgi:hypothetical protein